MDSQNKHFSQEEIEIIKLATQDFSKFAKHYIPHASLDNANLLSFLAKNELIPEFYSFSGSKFSRTDFIKFCKQVPDTVKVTISKEQLAQWGNVSYMNLGMIKNFDPMWLDAKTGVINEKQITRTKFPKDVDFTGVDFSGYKITDVDLSNTNLSTKQLCQFKKVTDIIPPMDFNIKEVGEELVNYLAPSICDKGGWKLRSRHVKNSDLTLLEGLNVGKLIANNNEFEGVTFPAYNWKSIVDMPNSPETADSLAGVSFKHCDLSAISGMHHWEAMESEIIDSILPSGVSYPKQKYATPEKESHIDIPF